MHIRFDTKFEKKFLSIAKVRGHMLSSLQKFARTIENELDSITASWEHGVPTKVQVGFRGGNAIANIWADDDIFNWLEEGTSIRWALMSKDWQSKTRPDHSSTHSFPGAGHVVLRGANAFNEAGIAPRDGIEPRNFYQYVADRHEAEFGDMVREAIRKGLG